MQTQPTEEAFENPFDVEEVVDFLSRQKNYSHKSYQDYSGVSLSRLARELGVNIYPYGTNDRIKIERQLREHPNIERSARSPFKYVPDEVIKERRDAKEAKQRRKVEREQAEAEMLRKLVALVEGDDRFRNKNPDDEPGRRWYRVNYRELYSLEFTIESRYDSTYLRVEFNYDVLDGPKENPARRVLKKYLNMYFNDVDDLLPALEKTHRWVLDMDVLGIKVGGRY